MNIVKFSYDIDRDIRNYQNSLFEFKYSDYGRDRPVVTGFLRPSFVKSLEGTTEVKDKLSITRKYLNDFSKTKADFISIQVRSLEEYWGTIEKSYIERLEDYFGVSIGFDKANCYLTTLTISPYNVKEKSFMTSFSNGLAAQANTVMHEFMHLVFRHNFDEYCTTMGVNQQGLLEINESLTTLLNYEFSEFTITPAYNKKPSIEDLQKKVVELWKEKKDFKHILDELIKMRV